MIDRSTHPHAASRRRDGWALPSVAWGAPLLLAVAYLITLAVQFSGLLATTYLNADAASAPMIGELFGQRREHSLTLLGHLGWYSTLLFERLTHWLPLHRQVWEGAPYAMALCSAVLVAWGLWRIAGRWAGAIALAVMVCAGPGLLSLLFVLNDHAPTWFTLALLGAFVVFVERRSLALWKSSGVVAVIVGIVLGANAASDVLLTIAGAVPMVLAVGATWALRPSRRTARAALYVAASGLVAIASGLALHAYMRHQDVASAVDARTSTLAAAESVGSNFRLWWQSIAVLGNSDFFGEPLGFSTALGAICGAMAVIAVLLIVPIARDALVESLAKRRRRAMVADGEPARVAWCLFWGSSAALLSVAFVFSGTPENLASDRYLVGLVFAAAALVPLLARRGGLWRAVITLGATIFAFAGWVALAQERIQPPGSPSDQLANAVAKIAREERLSVGYGGYWDAAPITWASHLGVKVFPVEDCDGNQHLCAFELHIITSWYTPRRGARTFLLSDPAYSSVPSAPTPDLGAPIAEHQVGTVTMYVYGYDIAERLFAL